MVRFKMLRRYFSETNFLKHPLCASALVSLWAKLEKQVTTQCQEVRKLNLWTSLDHVLTFAVLYPFFYLLAQKQASKLRDGWAECCMVSKSELSLTAAAAAALPARSKTKEPSLPVGLWVSRLWSGPERESSLMKYWCFSLSFFFFNCVLWELSLLCGCTRWSTALLRTSLPH